MCKQKKKMIDINIRNHIIMWTKFTAQVHSKQEA